MSRRSLGLLGAIVLVEFAFDFLLIDTASVKTVVAVLGIPSLSGGVLLVYEGIRCCRQAIDQLTVGSLVDGPSADDVGLIIVGILLLLPGLLTNILALMILPTPLRRYVGKRMVRLLTD